MTTTEIPAPSESARGDGGYAFPVSWGDNVPPTMGMCLRDWFAGQALVGMGDWTPLRENGTHIDYTDLCEVRRRRAEWSYAQADAMLAERGK